MTYYTIYTSTPREKVTMETLREITQASQKNNPEKEITGILLGIENKFLQYLEGPEENVNALYEKIWKDPRHQNVTQWIKGYSNDRVFKDWSMGSWMLTNDELKNLPALSDLKNFLDDPINSELQSKKFIAMMNDLLKTWIAHEPERIKKMRDDLSS
ncbi:BLUF domain-containing protein [Ekhidna sp. To15]|uniref:BLUF domain-containing protein n=1 Tax=Ekhidna sp. To15 TaxID=3395267 RepID=UPI003F522E95